jgi:hypothetical protein
MQHQWLDEQRSAVAQNAKTSRMHLSWNQCKKKETLQLDSIELLQLPLLRTPSTRNLQKLNT